MKLTEKQKNCPYCSPDKKVMMPIIAGGGQEAYLHMLHDKYSFPLKTLESVAGKKLNGEDYDS